MQLPIPYLADDGIVLAIVRLSWREGLFLASLVAWLPEEKRRALGLVPVTMEQAEEFQALASQDWDQLTSRLQQSVEMSSSKK